MDILRNRQGIYTVWTEKQIKQQNDARNGNKLQNRNQQNNSIQSANFQYVIEIYTLLLYGLLS